VEQAMPLVFKAISVAVERCLDFSDATILNDMSVSLDQLRIETWWLARARNEEFFDAGDWPGCSCLRYPGVSGRFGTYSGSRLKRRCITRPYQTTEHA